MLSARLACQSSTKAKQINDCKYHEMEVRPRTAALSQHTSQLYRGCFAFRLTSLFQWEND